MVSLGENALPRVFVRRLKIHPLLRIIHTIVQGLQRSSKIIVMTGSSASPNETSTRPGLPHFMNRALPRKAQPKVMIDGCS